MSDKIKYTVCVGQLAYRNVTELGTHPFGSAVKITFNDYEDTNDPKAA